MWLRTEETYRSEEGKNVCCIKQKTAYEMRISDWSSDVCSSDLAVHRRRSADVARIDPAGIERDVAAESGRLVLRQVVGPSGVARVLPDRKIVVSGQSVSVRVVLGARRILIKKFILFSFSSSLSYFLFFFFFSFFFLLFFS